MRVSLFPIWISAIIGYLAASKAPDVHHPPPIAGTRVGSSAVAPPAWPSDEPSNAVSGGFQTLIRPFIRASFFPFLFFFFLPFPGLSV
ncbi:uncharacterized protein LY79DRAFT_544786 [Colletotrichum navitas]|uniref:Secreted protein n=1 Tax=Colletotrichum navitas TaxID=681940 RepID=A0AAD8Q741_9PEZI|nr:uncharacterized protein LY79DRAFT_544786 [Colletotrichum navitas]KAK1596428.1 hypothetical protein LY79DRAFT_544786 [Colletotrichum navitas]